jgi:hypothetical protein
LESVQPRTSTTREHTLWKGRPYTLLLKKAIINRDNLALVCR